MTRRRALAALIAAVGLILLMSLATISAGTQTPPAYYAQLLVGTRTLDVWQNTSTGDLTFHWDDANETVAARYLPKRLIVAELSGGRAISVVRYPSRDAAWGEIEKRYRVTHLRVVQALRGATPAPAAPTAGVTVARARG